MFDFQQMLYLVLIIHFHYAAGYYKYFPGKNLIYPVKVGSGKTVINYVFKNANLKHKDWMACDPLAAWPHYLCDVVISNFVFVCKPFSLNPWWLARSIFLEAMEDRTIDAKEKAMCAKEGCDVSGPQYFEEDNNDYPVSKQTFKKHISNNYFGMILNGVIAHDRDYLYIMEFIWYSVMLVKIEKLGKLQYVVHYNNATNILFNISIMVECYENYYQFTCWRNCKASKRNLCDQDGNEICLDYWENVYMRYEIFRYYRSINFRYTTVISVSNCYIYNPCKEGLPNPCKSTTRCLPITNSSYKCVTIKMQYMIPSLSKTKFYNYRDIVSDESVIGVLTISPDIGSLIMNHTYCWWSGGSTREMTGMDLYSATNTMRFLDTVHPGYYKFSFDCLVGESYNMINPFYFYLYRIGTKVRIENLTLGFGNYIYRGQSLLCVVPRAGLLKELVINLTVPGNKFPYIMNRTDNAILYINLNAKLGICELDCTYYYLFRKRPFRFTRLVKEVFLQAYVKFGWVKDYQNVFYNNDTLGCKYSAYFVGVVRVKMLRGDYRMKIPDGDNFTIFTRRGGEFFFICALPAFFTNFVFYKKKYFNVFKAPSILCLQIHMAVPGVQLKCNHNGYPKEFAKVNTSLLIFGIGSLTGFDNIVQIPYYLTSPFITFQCIMHYEFRGKIRRYSYKTRLDLATTTRTIKGITNEDRECLLTDNKLFGVVVLKEEGLLEFFAEIMFMMVNDKFYLTQTVLFNLFYFPLMLLIISILIYQLLWEDQTEKTVTRLRVKRKRLLVQSRMQLISKFKTDKQVKKHDIYEKLYRCDSTMTFTDMSLRM